VEFFLHSPWFTTAFSSLLGGGPQLGEGLEEGAFPLAGGVQYADRRTFLCDAVREYGTRRKLAGCRENSSRLDLSLSKVHSTAAGVGPHTPPPQAALSASIFDFPVDHVERACQVAPPARER
jgi:hypothetical protein